MIGMVLWCDPRVRKAVIWCDDQGDLAFFDDPCGVGDTPFFEAGDMVQLEIAVEGNLRRAVSPRLVQEGVCTALPQQLRKCAPPPKKANGTIVDFPQSTSGAAPRARRALRR
jgi:hypothetical protein